MPEHQPPVIAAPKNDLPRASIVGIVASPSAVVTRTVTTLSKTRALSARAYNASFDFAAKQHASKVAPVISSLQLRYVNSSIPSLLNNLPSVATLLSSSASIALAARTQIIAIPTLQHWFAKVPESVASLAKSTDAKVVSVLERTQAALPASPRVQEVPSVQAESPKQVLEEQDSGFIFEPSQDFDESE